MDFEVWNLVFESEFVMFMYFWVKLVGDEDVGELEDVINVCFVLFKIEIICILNYIYFFYINF